MHLAYIDDSRDGTLACFCSIVVPAAHWMRFQNEIIEFRRSLKRSDGIHVTKELHATDFLAGRGHLGAVISETRRAKIFEEVLDFVASRPSVKVIPACAPRRFEDRVFERLVERLDVNAGKQQPPSLMMIISDEGKNYTGLVRRMRRYNFIPSKFGAWWPSGDPAQNQPITRIVEDIVFRDSKQSSFIQLADFCAFALLRSENPTPRITRLGLDKAFERLKPVLVPQAFAKDPRKLGIVREI